jgi:outer membrane protein OmpA-like peptidoglycan-associated protein
MTVTGAVGQQMQEKSAEELVTALSAKDPVAPAAAQSEASNDQAAALVQKIERKASEADTDADHVTGITAFVGQPSKLKVASAVSWPKGSMDRRAKPAAARPEQRVAVLEPQERQQLAKLVDARELPAVDMVIEFDYNSANLTQKAMPTLNKLGKVLTDGRLAGSTFVIAGHTDSVGSQKFNQKLSLRRARTVRTFLKDRYGIAGKRMVVVGYGEERLKNTSNPRAGENRRVEFVNLIR